MSKRGKGRGKGAGKDDDGEECALAYKFLSAEHTNELMPLPVLQIQSRLKEIFKLDNNETDLKEAAILDYYTSTIYWGIQQKLTAQQLSGFFSILYILLDNIKEKHMNLVDNVNELKKMLVGIGLEEVKSAGLDFFDLTHAKLITEYVYTTLFQHYNLFSFMFSHTQAEEIIGTDLTVEVAKAADVPFPPPLDDGVTEEMHSLYIATPPPSPSPEPGAVLSRASRSPRSGVATPKSRPVTRETPTKSRASTSKSGGSASKSRASAPKSRGATPKSVKIKVAASGIEQEAKLPEEAKADAAKELEESVVQSDLFSQLSPQDVREVIESVAKEMLGSLQSEVALKLKEKESVIIQRINKIHKVAE